jgi:hypothetical protein
MHVSLEEFMILVIVLGRARNHSNEAQSPAAGG